MSRCHNRDGMIASTTLGPGVVRARPNSSVNSSADSARAAWRPRPVASCMKLIDGCRGRACPVREVRASRRRPGRAPCSARVGVVVEEYRGDIEALAAIVHQDCNVYRALPSASSATTRRPGAPMAAPTATGSLGRWLHRSGRASHGEEPRRSLRGRTAPRCSPHRTRWRLRAAGRRGLGTPPGRQRAGGMGWGGGCLAGRRPLVDLEQFSQRQYRGADVVSGLGQTVHRASVWDQVAWFVGVGEERHR